MTRNRKILFFYGLALAGGLLLGTKTIAIWKK